MIKEMKGNETTLIILMERKMRERERERVKFLKSSFTFILLAHTELWLLVPAFLVQSLEWHLILTQGNPIPVAQQSIMKVRVPCWTVKFLYPWMIGPDGEQERGGTAQHPICCDLQSAGSWVIKQLLGCALASRLCQLPNSPHIGRRCRPSGESQEE